VRGLPVLALVTAAAMFLAACGRRRLSGSSDSGPTAAADDCRAAVANMRRLDPEEVAGDEADLATCRKLPRPVVACLTAASSRTAADACVHGYAPVRATPDECQRAMAHVRALVRALPDEDAALVAHCARAATRDDIACLLAARSAAEVQKCGYDTE
jgi:hypothetical protein